MRAYIEDGYLFIVGVPYTEKQHDALHHVANVLVTAHGIGKRQIMIDSSGFRAKNRTYELRAMIGHVHPGEASQEYILTSVKKELGMEAA